MNDDTEWRVEYARANGHTTTIRGGWARAIILAFVTMPIAVVIAAIMLAAGCCTAKGGDKPTVVDRVADVAAPLAKGYLCSQPTPPEWLPDDAWMAALWAAAQALVCTDAPPASSEPTVDAGVGVDAS